MMHGVTFTGNLFFDPLATNLGAGIGTCLGTSGTQESGSANDAGPSRKRGVQTAEEHKALRAASLSKVSRDLERMLRERKL